MRHKTFLRIAAQVIVASWATLWAQVEQSTVTGTVTDPTSASVPKSKVTATNVATGVDAVTETNELGLYRLTYLPAGQYSIRVEKPGFAVERITGIQLSVGTTATVNVVLKPGAIQQEITVTASGEVLLEKDNSSLGTVVDQHQMLQLPLLGRNPYALVTLAPGVLPNGNAGTGPMINGGPSNTSAVLLDGAETRNTTTNDIAYTPPLETVAEFKVITNNFSAEYGRSGGGVLTVAGTSGTNQIHGSAYEFFRNNDLNANGWTNNSVGIPRTAYRQNNFGFTTGGPVVLPHIYNGHNHTFFFFNFEANITHTPNNLIAGVPTAGQRVGDFSQTFAANGAQIQIFDPNAAQQISGNWTRQQFPGNQIPLSRINVISNNVLAYYPLPNRAGLINNYDVANTQIAQDLPKLYYRIDHDFGPRNRLFFRDGIQHSHQDTAWPGNIAFPGEGTNGTLGYSQTNSLSSALSDTAVLRNDVIGEFRATVSRALRQDLPRSVGYDFTALGLPEYLKAASSDLQFPYFSISDVTSIGPQRDSHDKVAQTTQDGQAHVTWMHGAHSVKTGLDYLFFAFNVTGLDYPSGEYVFARTFTQGPNPSTASVNGGYGLATFLLGAPTSGAFTLGPSLASSQRAYNWYLQDDWKLLRNLTLNLGVRYEYQTPWTERYNHLSYFNPNAIEPTTGLKGDLEFIGEDGGSRYQTIPQKDNFAPRVGLAWAADSSTVVRAGYGIFFFPGSGGIGGGVSDLGSGWELSTPTYLGPPAAAPSSPSPGGSLSNPFVTGLLQPPTNSLGGSVSAPFTNWVTPFINQWNFNVQRMVFHDLLIEAAYAGTRAEHIWFNIQADGVDPSFLTTLGTAINNVVTNPYYGKISVGDLSGKTVRVADLLMPFPQYNGVAETRAPIGDSIYHGFTLKAEKRLRHGLQFQAAYTVSKLLTDVPERFGGRSAIIDPYNLALSRSLGDFDRSQFLSANYIYELPFGRGKMWAQRGVPRVLFSNWQVSSILSFGTGMPIVITGPSNTQLPGISAAAVRLTFPGLSGSQRSLSHWFNTAAFAPAPAYSLGSDSRTEPNVRAPGLENCDLGVSRTFAVNERVRIQFRSEFFSVTNTPIYAAPDGTLTDLTFGQITSATGGTRNVQFALRLTY